MQNSLLRLAVALLTFGVGVSATMFWIAYRTPEAKRLEARSCYARRVPPPPPAMWADELPPPTPPAQPRFGRAPISGGLLDDKMLSKPAPVYPRAAVASGASGVVKVHVVVDESGKVISAKALSGDSLLQEAAVDAAYQARFAPAVMSGLPIKISGTLTYSFVLP